MSHILGEFMHGHLAVLNNKKTILIYISSEELSYSAIKNLDFSLFFSDVWPILLPMIVGCIPFYLASWMLSYIGLYHYLKKVKK